MQREQGRIKVDQQLTAAFDVLVERVDQQVRGVAVHRVGQDHARHRLATGLQPDEFVIGHGLHGQAFFVGSIQPGLGDGLMAGVGIGQQQHQA